MRTEMQASLVKSPTQALWLAVDLGKNLSQVPAFPSRGPQDSSPLPTRPMQRPDDPGEKLSQLPHHADKETGPERGRHMPRATQGK